MRGIELPTQLVIVYLLLHLRFIGLMFSSPVFTSTMPPTPTRDLFVVLLTVVSIGTIGEQEIPMVYFDSVPLAA